MAALVVAIRIGAGAVRCLIRLRADPTGSVEGVGEIEERLPRCRPDGGGFRALAVVVVPVEGGDVSELQAVDQAVIRAQGEREIAGLLEQTVVVMLVGNGVRLVSLSRPRCKESVPFRLDHGYESVPGSVAQDRPPPRPA